MKKYAHFLINLIFYLAFPVIDGPVWCKDSLSYTTMDYSREPLYPLFLALLRRIFGDGTKAGAHLVWAVNLSGSGDVRIQVPFYLFVAVLLQSVLAAVVVTAFVRTVVRYTGKTHLSLHKTSRHDPVSTVITVKFNGLTVPARTKKEMPQESGVLRTALLTAPFWGVQLLSRFGAQRASTYEESIMTEGIGISLYVLFILCLWLYVRKHRRRDLLRMGLLVFLCISLRKQLAVTVIIACLVSFFYDVCRPLLHSGRRAQAEEKGADEVQSSGPVRPSIFQELRRFLCAALVCASAFVLSMVFDCAYNKAVHGVFASHTGNSMGICSSLFYTARESDAQYCPDEESAELFRTITAQIGQQKLSFYDLPEGAAWTDIAEQYALAYDQIGYGVMNSVIDGYLKEKEPELDGMAFYQRVDDIESHLRDGLMHQAKGPVIRVWLANFGEALMNTALRMSPALIPAVAMLYAAWAGLLGAAFVRRRDGGARTMGTVTAASILVNCAVVSAVIFPQTRYMIYNMALFYASGIFMLEAQWG